MRIAAALLVAALAAAAPRGAHGQLAARSVSFSLRRTAEGPGPARPVRTAAAVVLDLVPREYRVVRIAVPPEFAAAEPVGFDVELREGVHVLGATRGVLKAGEAGRAVMLTLSPSALLAAGDTVAAIVVFHSSSAVVRVPVVVRVAARPGVVLTAERTATAARPGDRVEVRYRIRNTGNVTLRLTLTARAPGGRWRARDPGGETLELVPGATRVRVIVVDVPANADEGARGVAVAAADGGVEMGTALLFVNVLRGGDRVAHAPRLTASVGNAFAGAGGGSLPALALALGGELAGGGSVQGQLDLVAPTRDPAALRTLGALGFVQHAGFLAVSGRRWSLRGGDVALVDDALGGVGVWGQGASVGWRDTLWRADATVARPVAGRGRYLSAGVAGDLGVFTLGSRVAVLEDSSAARRSLTSLVVGVGGGGSGEGAALQWSVEAGSRAWDGGSGIGASAELRQRSESGSLLAQAVLAPGGSRAFALAEREAQVSLTRRLGPAFEIGGSAWLSRDGNAAFSALRSSGWELRPELRATSWLTLGVRVRRNAFDAQGAVFEFGTRETEFTGTAGLGLGPLALGFAAGTGPLTQTLAVPGGPPSTRSITRLTRQVTARWAGWWGVLEAELTFQRNGAGLGLPATTQTYLAGLSAVPLPLGRLGATGRVEWSELRSSPSAPLRRVALGVDVTLPGAAVLSATAERDEAFYGRGVPVPWVFGLRVAHAFPVRALSPHGGGVVFEDLNGNGRRDPGERGVPGVVVLVDGRAQATDARGRFDAPVGARAEIDAGSLPVGWIVSGADGRDLGVVPTGSLAVTLALGADPFGRTAALDFQRVVVAAYDTAGRRWAYQPSADGHALFDALPAGAYRVELEMPDGSAPPQVRETGRVAVVRAGGEPAAITLTILPRRARIQRIEGDGGGAGAAPRGPTSP